MANPTLFPTVAISDFVFTVATFYSFTLNLGHNMFAVIAFLSMMIAASFGVLRFGVSTSYYSKHAFATEISKFIGFPMLSLAVGFADLERRNKPFSYIVDVLILIALWYVCQRKYKIKQYETFVTIGSVLLMIGTATLKSFDLNILLATALYAVGGLVMGGSVTPGPLGFYKVNWFHYLISIGNILYGISLTQYSHV